MNYDIKDEEYIGSLRLKDQMDKEIVICRELGEDFKYYIFEDGNITTPSKDTCIDLWNVFYNTAEKIDFTEKAVKSGLKFKDLPVSYYMPELGEENIKINKLLDKVLHIMKDAYPEIGCDSVVYRLPYIEVEEIDPESDDDGLYNPIKNYLGLRTDRYNSRGIQTAYHEMLHLASSKQDVDMSGDVTYTNICGFNAEYGYGVGINEGITELLTEEQVGTNGCYPSERMFAKMLKAIYNDDDKFLKKYFNNDFSLFTEVFGTEEKANRFISLIDNIHDYNNCVCDAFKKKSDENLLRMLKEYGKENDIEIETLEDSFLTVDKDVFADMDYNAYIEASQNIDFEFNNASFIADAQNLILDVYEERMKTFNEDDRRKVTKEIFKNFISDDYLEILDDTVANGDHDDVEDISLTGNFYDREAIVISTERLFEIASEYYSTEEQYNIIEEGEKEIEEEFDKAEERFNEGKSFDEFLEL